MAIKTIREPDLHLTSDEIEKFRQEFQRDYSYWSGPLPTFESYCRRRKEYERDGE